MNLVASHFELTDETGHRRSPSDLMGAKGLLLVFIQGTWCPPCITTLYYLSRHAPALQAAGVHIAVIAMDEAATLRTFKASASLPVTFPLLGDPDNAVRNAFGVSMLETYLLLDDTLKIHDVFIDEDSHSKPSLQILKQSIQQHLA